jgi:hypothetical protein
MCWCTLEMMVDNKRVGLDLTTTYPSSWNPFYYFGAFLHANNARTTRGAAVVSAGSPSYDLVESNQETGYDFGVYSIIPGATRYFFGFLMCSRYRPVQGSQVSHFVSPLSSEFEVTLGS